jgi:glutamine kinase
MDRKRLTRQIAISAGIIDERAETWLSKARTLERLRSLIHAAQVPESLRFDHATWCRARNQSLAQIQLCFAQRKLAVRSSRHDEDRRTLSQAGRYRSELDVPCGTRSHLAASIDAVFRSYGDCAGEDEVLVQPMVIDPRACYVAATHTFDDGAPYYVLDFAAGVRTDVVTRGDAATTTLYLARDVQHEALEEDHQKILYALRELEGLYPDEPLEAEFVLSGGCVILLQVRPIAQARVAADTVKATRLRHSLGKRIAQREKTDVDLLGNTHLYGLMPDWNPAELLGAHPRPLALSLFRYLITRSNWRCARADLGYRQLPSGDLLMPLAGRPYVDVRLSFNSLLPTGLAPRIGTKLVDAWLARLCDKPGLHDKVEFDVVSTCLDFDFQSRQQALYPGLLTVPEWQDYARCLHAVTQRCLQSQTLQRATRSLLKLQKLLDAGPAGRAMQDLRSSLRRASRLGARPYAQIARQAFVAETLLRSAQRGGALSAERLLALRQSISGVSGEFLRSWSRADNATAQSELHARYGHLRPGTFEISVPSYAQQGVGFDVRPHHAGVQRKPAFAIESTEREVLNGLAQRCGNGVDADLLIDFYRAAVQAREIGKFILARAVSIWLDDLTRWSDACRLPHESLPWLRLEQIFAPRHSVADHTQLALAAQRRYEVERVLRLPALLSADDNLSVVRCAPGEPNFIGRGVIEARIVEVTRQTRPVKVPLHCIIAIESADPGFDWIFARAPAAIVTGYGGPNSHMAIRCAELHCPAVLGLGVEALRRALRNFRLSIDFDSGLLRGAST